jgi:hypothetical protein
MTNINLALHITGPTWAWLALCVMAAITVTLQAVKLGLEIYLRFLKRKAVAAAMNANRRSF